MLNLDREKFSLAKNINELESGSHALETTLVRLKDELDNVAVEDDSNKENDNTDDATLYPPFPSSGRASLTLVQITA
jgi:kinetochore protein Spc24